MIRSLARNTLRSARAYSTRPAASSVTGAGYRNFAIAASAAAVVGGLAFSGRSSVLNDSGVPRESVLDSDSLKQPVHRRDGDEKKNAGAPSIVQQKKVEAEETSGAQGAFNEETGEINWDCPCLGGMADGPCGPQFKEAFSCFVFSEAEPKGVDCVEKFKGMQDCFRQHPDIYGEEIDDEDEGEAPPDNHHAAGGVPKAPNAEPPSNSPITKVTPENTMSKGRAKLQPKEKRPEKGGVAGPPGDGTA